MKLKRSVYTFVLTLFILCLVTSINAINSQDPANQTNNTTNTTNSSSSLGVQPLVAQSITVTPASLNLGTLLADNIQNSFLNSVSVTSKGTGTGNLYVRAVGDFTQTGNISSTITLANFKYNGFGNAALPITPLTTTNYLVNTFTGNYNSKVSVNYYLTVPYGTPSRYIQYNHYIFIDWLIINID